MSATISTTDPGVLLGKSFLRIGQAILTVLILGCGHMAHLASEGYLTGWNAEFDSKIASIFSGQDPDTILFYFFIAAGIKMIVLLAFLVWLYKKI
jgi:hypothetical protein